MKRYRLKSNKYKGLFLKSGGKWYDKTLFAVNPDGTPATISSIIKYGKANEVEHPHVIEFLERSTRQLPNRTLEQPADEGLADKRTFMTSAERVLKSTVKGFQPVDQVLNTLRNKIPPTEWQILKDAGIEEAFGPAQRVDAQEVQKWIDENGPRVEVRKFGGSKREEAQKLRDEAYHRLETIDGGFWHRTTLNREALAKENPKIRYLLS